MFNIDTETWLFYGFISLIVLVIATLIFMLIHSGFFTEINVQTCKPCIGEIRIAYKSARGPYKESGSLFTEAHSLLPQCRTIGVYYDDPRKKEPTRLRYIVGLIISENGEPVNAEHEALLQKWNYRLATFPSINHAVQTSFPFKSTISIIVAVFRVYPILNEYIEMRSLCAHPFIEIYDSNKGLIYFVGPLEKQDDFYVPEVFEDEEKSQIDDEEEQSAVSWDESASYIKSDGFDSDSVMDGDQSASNNSEASLASDMERKEDPFEDDASRITTDSTVGAAKDLDENQKESSKTSRTPADEDSDNNTASSFEEIDEKEAPEIREERVSDQTEKES